MTAGLTWPPETFAAVKIPRQTPRPPAIAPPSESNGVKRKPAQIPISARINVPEN